MRTITADECLLLASFIKHPELIAGYTDLQRHHFISDFPWLVYQRLTECDIDRILNNSPYIVGTDLSVEKLISSDEFNFIHDDFNCFATSYTAQDSYDSIIERFDVIKIKEKVSRIIQQEMTSDELKENISNVLTGTTSHDEPMIPITDVKSHVDSCGFNFGFPRLDNDIDIERTDLVIIAARPFSGKTTFAVQLAMELTRFGKIHFWSMEMSKGRIKEKVNNYGAHYKPENFYIRECTTTTIQRIHKHAIIQKPVAIFIDQLNKVQAKGSKEYEQFSNAAKGLKELAGVLKIPIFCLAQINRDAKDGQPNLHQLKGSGSIEEESDVVLLLHVVRDGVTDIYLDKNRTKNGARGEYSVEFGMDSKIYYNLNKVTRSDK